MKINSINGLGIIKQKNFEQETQPEKKSSGTYKQLTSISNIYYKPLSFGRSWAEHKSWGAQIDSDTKEASFKLLTYPDTKKVTVTVTKRDNNKEKTTYELQNKGSGIFETTEKIPAEKAAHGDRYSYTIYKGNGDVDTVKDPYSFRQEKLQGASTLYDHSLYPWSDADWFSSDTKRVSRKANHQNGLTPVNALKVYEFNTATFTRKGTFESAKSKLKSIKDMGFNAIEIMPLENTYSFNWGYDGIDKLAPSEHLGGPDGLKGLIDYAHNLGLNVIIDMVPNHAGEDGSDLQRTGPFLKGKNAFGDAFNLEGKDSVYVRDYIVNLALNWLDNYHCDGLRLDMTKFMDSDYTMKQIAAEINYHKPDAFLIAEDARDKISADKDGNYWDNPDEPHDKRVTNPLVQYESAEGLDEESHIQAIERISDFDTSLGRLGYNSEWDFNYFHSLKNNIYDNVNLDWFEKACYCSQDRVKYVMSHDEIGNHEGTRLTAKLMAHMLQLETNMEDQKDVNARNRAAQFAAEKLAMMLQTGQLDKYNTDGLTSKRWINAVDRAFKDEILKPLGIKTTSNINYQQVNATYNKALSKYKMALARTYSIPGPKMVFQGDERADLTPFRFFRELKSKKYEEALYKEKGYNTGKPAFIESKLDRIRYSASGKSSMTKIRNLTRDLNLISAQNPALVNGKLVIENTVKHPESKVIATLARDSESNNEIFSVTNFSDASYPRLDAQNYGILFPKGQWIEILNTDDKKYGGNGNTNTGTITSDGYNNSQIKLSGDSTLIFKRIA